MSLLAAGLPLSVHAQSSDTASPPASTETTPGSKIPIAHHHVEIPAGPADASAHPLHVADLGGIEEWRKGGDKTVFIRDDKDQWYKLTLLQACMKLDTSGGIRFITELSQASQKVSYVDVAHHQCRITSMAKVDAPG
jgi:hypothetical protein